MKTIAKMFEVMLSKPATPTWTPKSTTVESSQTWRLGG